MGDTFRLAACEVDLDRLLVLRGATRPARLTPREARVLAALTARPGVVVARADLAASAGLDGPRAVDGIVARLRRKLEADPASPRHLVTHHGEGYRFEPLVAGTAPPERMLGRPERSGPVLALGPVRVDLGRRTVDHPAGPRHLTPQEARLLAYLAARPGRTVDRDELLGRVWGYRATRATRTLDTAMRTLRAKVEPTAGDPRYLVTVRGTGYRFEPDPPDDVPSGVVALVGVAVHDDPAVWADDPVGAAERRAAHDAVLEAERARFGGVRAWAGPDDAVLVFPTVEAALGWADAVRAAVPPLRGAALGTAVVLHRAEPIRQASAGSRAPVWIGPDVGLVLELARAVRGPWTVATAAAAEVLGARAADRGAFAATAGPVRLFDLGDGFPGLARGNVRRRTDRFVGRDALFRAVLDGLAPGGISVLVGPPGVGKSRLAAEVARGSGTEAWWCPSGRDPAGALAEALGLARAEGVPDALAHRGPAVVVLDDADERALAAVAGWALPEVRWLATMRVRPDPCGARIVPVPPLDPASAEALLRDRVEARGLRLDGPVAALLERLDGLPLAIELVAARIEQRSVAELVEQLDALLQEPLPGADPRHASLDAALSASWAALGPAPRRALARLSALPGTFDRAAAGAVGAGEDLGELLRASLVRPVAGPTRRFALLDAVRRFAARRCPDEAERGRALAARHFAAVATGEADLREERDHLAAAIAWGVAHGEAAVAADAASSGIGVLRESGEPERALTLAEAVLALDLDPARRARVLGATLHLALHLGHRALAAELAEEAGVRARDRRVAPGDRIRLRLWRSWWRAAHLDDLAGALDELVPAARLARERSARQIPAVALQRADLLRRVGRAAEAEAVAAEGIARCRDPDTEGQLRAVVASVAVERGDGPAARAWIEPALLRLDGRNGASRSAVASAGAVVLAWEGAHRAAAALLRAEIPAIRAAGYRVFAADRLFELAQIEGERGRWAEAERHLHEALALRGADLDPAPILAQLALAAAALGRPEPGAILARAEAADPRYPLLPVVRGRLHLAAGRPEQALREVEGARYGPGWLDGAFARVEGEAAAALGQRDRAREAFRRALAGWSVDALVARCDLALLDGVDDPGLLPQAEAWVSRMGAAPGAELADRVRRLRRDSG